jgi:hypothetical protein
MSRARHSNLILGFRRDGVYGWVCGNVFYIFTQIKI